MSLLKMAIPGPSPMMRTVVPGSWSEIYRAIRELNEPILYVAPAPVIKLSTEPIKPETDEMIFESFKKTIAIAKTHTIKPLDIS
jgi:hypothetical protein